MDWKVVPIERWPTELTKRRKEHSFRKTVTYRSGDGTERTRTVSDVDWGATTTLLERELRELRAKQVLLQMAVGERDIRLDGWIKANARPAHPGVILTFESKHGPLSYPCDNFTEWQANVRAIALSLEALRKVDRYGVSRRGEQYTGWGRLPPAGGTTETMTAQVAANAMANIAGRGEIDPDDLLESHDAVLAAYRKGAKVVHPDVGGSARDFQLLAQAKRVLDAHHGAGGR